MDVWRVCLTMLVSEASPMRCILQACALLRAVPIPRKPHICVLRVTQLLCRQL
jgi:hypothetical protein